MVSSFEVFCLIYFILSYSSLGLNKNYDAVQGWALTTFYIAHEEKYMQEFLSFHVNSIYPDPETVKEQSPNCLSIFFL